MRSSGRIIYWTITGALMGIGFIAFSLGMIPTALGLVMAIFGLIRFRPKGFWMVLFSMGLFPALILVFDYVIVARTTSLAPDPYLYLAALFGAIAVLGLALGVLESRRRSKPQS